MHFNVSELMSMKALKSSKLKIIMVALLVASLSIVIFFTSTISIEESPNDFNLLIENNYTSESIGALGIYSQEMQEEMDAVVFQLNYQLDWFHRNVSGSASRTSDYVLYEVVFLNAMDMPKGVSIAEITFPLEQLSNYLSHIEFCDEAAISFRESGYFQVRVYPIESVSVEELYDMLNSLSDLIQVKLLGDEDGLPMFFISNKFERN